MAEDRERDRLVQIVLALAQTEPTEFDPHKGDTCVLCGESAAPTLKYEEPRIVHQFNCPWVRAYTWAKESEDPRWTG